MFAAFLSCGPALAQTGPEPGANPNPGFEARESSNPAHPTGWVVLDEEAGIELDSVEARSGKLSLKIQGGARDDFGAVGRSVQARGLAHTRVTVSGYIKTRAIFPGYAGLLLQFDGGTRTLFVDEMRGRGASGTSEWSRFETSALVPAGATGITFGAVFPGAGTAWFDDVTLETEVPVQPRSPPPSSSAELDPVAYVSHAIDLMEARSLVRDSVDWDALRTRHLSGLGDASALAEAYAAIQNALVDLGDGHSQLLTPDAVAAREDPDAAGGGPSTPVASDVLAGHVGYLRVPGFIGTSRSAVTGFARELDTRIANVDAQGVCGWVLDLRENPGGNMWPMLAGLSALLGDGLIGAFQLPDGTTTPWTLREGTVLDGRQIVTGLEGGPRTENSRDPVAVVTGRGTASAGEAVAVAFRRRPETRSFGEPTRGLSTTNATLRLGDGAVIELTTAVIVDREGTPYGEEIAPDEPVLIPPDGANPTEDPALRRSADWIRSRAACRS